VTTAPRSATIRRRGTRHKQDTKRALAEGRFAKMLLELVELTGIEPVTS
jgi:hypothetical protein